MKKFLCLIAILALVSPCFAKPIRIMVFGDSLSWGFIPNEGRASERYPADSRWPGVLQKTKYLSKLYEGIARLGGADFFDAGTVITTDGPDGLHLTAEAEKKLGTAVATKVKEILK